VAPVKITFPMETVMTLTKAAEATTDKVWIKAAALMPFSVTRCVCEKIPQMYIHSSAHFYQNEYKTFTVGNVGYNVI
jgi:hypothetical protein